MKSEATPLAAILIPTLNEAAHIGGLIEGLLLQSPDAVVEIIVADGGSTDGTRDLVNALAKTHPKVRLIDNPARIQSAGVNRASALADARATALIRIDAHSEYPADFVGSVLRTLRANDARSVVVPMISVGMTPFQRAVAAVSNSTFGTGGAAHRIGGESRFIDHGHHAAFDREAFAAIGGYDETFVANEDAEFDARLRAWGGKIWFAGDLGIRYYPRATARGLIKQYFRYGVGRAQTMLKHRERPRLRQLIPPAVVLLIAAALIAAPLWPWTLLAPLGYLAAVVIAALLLAVRTRDAGVLLAVIALPIMHIVWGSALIYGLLFPSRRP